jgi:hypothetical protein
VVFVVENVAVFADATADVTPHRVLSLKDFVCCDGLAVEEPSADGSDWPGVGFNLWSML